MQNHSKTNYNKNLTNLSQLNYILPFKIVNYFFNSNSTHAILCCSIHHLECHGNIFPSNCITNVYFYICSEIWFVHNYTHIASTIISWACDSEFFLKSSLTLSCFNKVYSFFHSRYPFLTSTLIVLSFLSC